LASSGGVPVSAAWTDGRNARIEYRWGLGDTANIRKYAGELAALAPDVSPMLLALADEVIE
jgi:hypothetical protein